MTWLANAAFGTVFVTVFALWWLDGHLIRRPGESLWQLWVAMKSDRRHVWSALGPALYLLAVLIIPGYGGSSWWMLLALPAYVFLLGWWLKASRTKSP